MPLYLLCVFLIPVFIASCGSSDTGDGNGGGGGGGGEVTFRLEDAFPGVTFESPVDLQNAGDGTDRLFVLEQRGVIMAVTPLTASSGNDLSAENSYEAGRGKCFPRHTGQGLVRRRREGTPGSRLSPRL